MSEHEYETLAVETAEDVARVNLDRPDVRNAFNEQMIADLTDVFERLGRDPSLRAIVLGGKGTLFCAGADIDWMRRSADRSERDNVEDARAMATMYRTIDECPVPVIGRAHKAAFGGAIGLLAVCDVVVAARGTKMAFSEVKLGIIPAVISTFSLPKIGANQARRYFLTAEVFTPETAPAGLVHEVVDESELDATVEGIVAALRGNGPQAVREAKRLVRDVTSMSKVEAIDMCIKWIARVRVGEEAQEGLRAFLGKRDAAWKK
jgi:methylglutaconyl-CoA hydratase